MNQADSARIEEQLRAAGAEEVAPSEADLVIVNTCSVTATADQGARQTVRRIARDNPEARIIPTGCYATRSPAEVGALSGVSQVIGNRDKEELVSLLAPGLGLTTAQRFGEGQGGLRGRHHPRAWKANGVHPSRSDRMQRVLRILHHSLHSRTWTKLDGSHGGR